jgi:hypothetical protein
MSPAVEGARGRRGSACSSRGGLRKRSFAGLTLVAIGLTALLGAAGSGFSAGAAREAAAPKPSAGAAERNALEAYGKLPLAFVRNVGQSDARVRYSAQASGASFAFTPREAVFAFTKGKRGHSLGLRFVGASKQVEPEGAAPLPGKVNYLLGNDPATWRTGLPTYGEVVYREVWPGIDLAFRGDGRALKYELRLAPGADPGAIRLAYRGQKRLSLGRSGGLRLDTSLGVLRDSRPVSYQVIDGRRVPVASNFVLGQNGDYGFEVGRYDVRRPLVIDPGLLYSTYLGGSGVDAGGGIAVDGAGSAYVTGQTTSADVPTTVGAFDTTYNGGGSDAFVTKLNAAGSAPLLYSTYLGGSGDDVGRGIAVDGTGSAYVTGFTSSGNFPTTVGAFDATYNGVTDAFVTKLNAGGSAPLYSTYLGGSAFDAGHGIALDGANSAYVTGFTHSGDFPTTPGGFDTTLDGPSDAFVTKLNPAGSAPLVYSTYLGGSSEDIGFAIAVDGTASAYVTGSTRSIDFPTTVGAFDTSHNGNADAFVTKLTTAGSALLYSTYLGGSDFDSGRALAVDTFANAYVTGETQSTDFPTTPGAFDPTYNGGFNDAYVTKLNSAGSAPLVYSTYLGGSDIDSGFGIAVDGAGSAYVTGFTGSTDFPTTPGAFDTTYNGGVADAYVTGLNAAGSAPLLDSTYLGGSAGDIGAAIAVDSAGSAYVTGSTSSNDFPTTVGAFDTTYNGGFSDAFVTKLGEAAGAPATLTLDPPADTNTVGETHCVTATVRDAVGNPVPGVTVRFSVPTAAATAASPSNGSDVTDADGEATFCYSAALPGEDVIHAFADTDEDGMQDADEPFGEATKTWILPPSTELCEVTITQGGWIIAANGDRASVGGNARVREDGSVDGHENYQDHGPAQPRHVQSIELTAVTCSEDLTAAAIFGRATVDGAGDFVFRIDVTDMGEPGSNDTYGITMSDGYASGQQRLQGGDVQIHKS